MYESLKEALLSDGTPFVEVSDADISAGILSNADGSPRYPILISLASEAISNDEIAPLRNYVWAGGFLFIGSSAFTRNPDGTTRGDFALANEMGLHMVNPNLINWYFNGSFTKVDDHRLVSHIPSGTLVWRMPASSEQIPLGTLYDRVIHRYHDVWQVSTTDAQVLANGDSGPLITTKSFGQGYFIYHGAVDPIIGHGGYDPGMYAYLIFRRAIEWAFENANLPIIKLSPWRYPYDAAFIVRHDLENSPRWIGHIEVSAQYDQSVGAKGDYYFCTGVVRPGSEDHQLTEAQKLEYIAMIQRAVSLYGATIGSHNGGLPNPWITEMEPNNYNYWHWGPDEALDINPPGYTSGKAYAQTSINNSLQDIEGWLVGLDTGRVGCGAAGNCPRTWVSPNFNSIREDSFDIEEQLRIKTTGEQKISPFPHWTLSTQTRGKRYSFVTIPTSDWFVGNEIAQSIADHDFSSLDAAIDFYYAIGALVNIYTHVWSNDGGIGERYITYSLSKPRMWSTNAVGIYDWWQVRSTVVVTPTFEKMGSINKAIATITNATDSDTAIEITLPNWASGNITINQVLLNGAPANPVDFRATSYGVKIRVGAAISSIEVQYTQSEIPLAPPANVSISKSSNNLILSWLDMGSSVNHYEVWRANNTPYFMPGNPGSSKIADILPDPLQTHVFTDIASGIGDTQNNSFYLIRTVFNSSATSISNRTGEFDFRLQETAGTDYTWVALPLSSYSIHKASELANYIQSNSDNILTVQTISRWNDIAQSYDIYYHEAGFGDFPVVNQYSYRVEVDINNDNNAIWTLVGDVPSIGSYHYTLYETAGTDYTWIMQPLDKTTITNTIGLAGDIESHSSTSLMVLTISKWNAIAEL
jgi:hypothetical protein